jgi:predicted RNA-binding Zn-ribbon protein involved in translation (DUF1610 family)
MRKPRSLLAFQKAFPDEEACAVFLFERRWPEGFICPKCGDGRAVLLRSRAWTYQCVGCRRQTSVTAGTAMHRSKLPLTVWFWAAHLMATHSNDISALQLRTQLPITYKTATTRAWSAPWPATSFSCGFTASFSLLKRLRLGTYHGLRRKHIDAYLNEFVFRYNRRFYRHVSFETVLGLAAHRVPASYWDIIERANPRKRNVITRIKVRRRKAVTGLRRDGFKAGIKMPLLKSPSIRRRGAA